jgi:hypothetical protein
MKVIPAGRGFQLGWAARRSALPGWWMRVGVATPTADECRPGPGPADDVGYR